MIESSRTAPGPGALTAAVLLIVALAAALSVNVVKTVFGIKGDESTYVAMALSLAYDGDLRFQRRDLERFTGIYRQGPEGIFLKRGRFDRIYFGKALIYPAAAAPFVRAFGMNGFLVLHVLLLFGVGVCGYLYLVSRSRPGPALIFTLAFVGAAAVPVWAAFLTSDLFNFAVVFVAYFFWLYKETAPPDRLPRFLRGRASDVCAAALLGAVTYSKLSNAPLLVPIVVLAFWRRQFGRAALIGAVWAASVAALFGVNAVTSGEFNYQGGDRKIFYGKFPFDAPDATWDTRGLRMTTNRDEAQDVLERIDPVGRLGVNLKYFLVGRHFGFIPYFFPGVVAIILWLRSKARAELWRVTTFVVLVGSALILLFVFPYTWSGGGGPPGNRYFLSFYPALFFLMPPPQSSWPGVLAWLGGALFTAKMLVNPFVAAKFTYETTDRGFARRLPVELTMANDLPIMLDASRTRIWFSDVLLYFLDYHAYIPEVIEPPATKGIWIAGDGRADILVRCEWPIDHLSITARSPINTTFIVSMGKADVRMPIAAGKSVTLDVPAAGVRGLNSYAYLLSARSTEAFTPHLVDASSDDYRNLGVLITFKAVPASK